MAAHGMSEGSRTTQGEVTAVVYGVGAMGLLCTRLLAEKRVSVVGAVTRKSHLGADLGEIAGLGRTLGVEVSADAEALLDEQHVDVALVCTGTRMADVVEQIERCVRHGANVITTAEEALFPWRIEPEVTARLDLLAKKHGVSVIGSGYTDYYWGGEVMQLAGTCHRIRRMEGMGRFNIDDYGIAVAQNNRVGMSVADLGATFDDESAPAFLQAAADLLCAGLGLHVAEVVQTLRPATEEVDVFCHVLDRVVRAGEVTGKVTTVDADTSEGVELHLELQERLYRNGETDLNRWVILGEPDAVLENPSPATGVLTCATMVNRIPDVLAAAPGLITVDRLPKLTYRPAPLAAYCQESLWGSTAVE